MQFIKWVIILSFWFIVAAFLHYTLPQKDIVRIVNTYEERQELGDWTRIFWAVPDDQSAALVNRDVQFIQAVRESGAPIVYRNEDTGWGWPPYFKFDTANLYTDANDAISTKAAPEWVLITHYGWRNEFLSIFPNAISIEPMADPAAGKPLPWVNILILGTLAFVFGALYLRWRRFRARRIDPALENLQDGFEATGDALNARRSRFRRWLNTWRS